MINFHECKANAAECQRMADSTVNPAEKQLWNEMATHWRYVSSLLPKGKLKP
jgi:hypothetical protein